MPELCINDMNTYNLNYLSTCENNNINMFTCE